MEAERRILRSADPSRAIRLFLAQNADDAGLRAAAVASDDGLLLGGVGNDDLEALAALGSAKGSGRDVAQACAREGWLAEGLYATALQAGEHRFTVATLGAPLSAANDVQSLLGRLLA